ncbi:hypothetical protein CCACVL1_12222 [Corchorus capsularis]|uniref:Uncharacterized protein n=1 Tax=Corchorus capsularis TaxID=210143 RepID=A0A1R3IGR1_COCAP|nr:hypothetical protein CCACVL1_12222 [Corchorus capsularis]
MEHKSALVGRRYAKHSFRFERHI